jgi:hypothetical protein
MSVIYLLLACGGSDVYQGAQLAPIGTNYTLTTSSTSSTTYYRISDGGEAVEASALVEVAPDCIAASAVLSTRKETSEEEEINLLQVVAHTNLNHPLVPDENDVFSARQAMILQNRSRVGSYTLVEETLYDPTNFATYSVNTYADDAQETESYYFGVTADEYVVRFDLGTLWSDFEDLTPGAVELWTKNNPVVGDVWVSENGNTLYIYAGIDVLTLGSLPQEVHKVDLYEVGAVQPDGSDVYDDCLDIGANQIQSTDPNQTQQSLEEVFLDTGCGDAFTHVKTGTQWWYQNLLIKEEASSMEIEIMDYGFEWYESDAATGSCARLTDTVYGDPLFPAQAYIEYALTTKTYTTESSDWVQPQ